MAISMTAGMAAAASEAAALLRALSHEGRLLVLCALAEGEAQAGALVALSGLSQSALSQHLARLREEGLVATRRDSTAIFYRLAEPKARRIVRLLHDMYCPKGDRT